MENNSFNNDEINFIEIYKILSSNKIKLSILSFIMTISLVLVSFSIPNIYKSNAVLVPMAESSNNLSKIANSFSGIASFAGISLPQAGEVDEVAASIEMMKSLNFFEDFIKEHDLFFTLEAYKGWDRKKNILIIDKKKYDTGSKSWVSNQKYAKNGKPSIQTAHRNFLKNFSSSIDKKSGLITLSFQHYSPYVAKDILEKLIQQINFIKKEQDIKFAERSVAFLETEASKSNIKEVREVIYLLAQKQIETIVLANAAPEYLLKQLSKPVAPELKHSPNRILMLILGFIFSIILSISYVLIAHFLRNKKE